MQPLECVLKMCAVRCPRFRTPEASKEHKGAHHDAGVDTPDGPRLGRQATVVGVFDTRESVDTLLYTLESVVVGVCKVADVSLERRKISVRDGVEC